ncbi:MAG: S1/P1 nuclease [Bacteroidia bacterium]|nr:S1/P1 nuclease [Bacteroidia bacterium]
MKKFVLAGFIFLGSFGTAFGWGARGHKIVAQIARQYIDKSVMDSIDAYLDDITFEKASYWMDEVKMNINYDFMLPWHFVSIEADKTYVRGKTPDIVVVLEKTINTLKNKKTTSSKETLLSLKVLIHLVADIHNPVNCGFVKDRNGKNVKLRFFFKSTTLHDVWEDEILEYQKLTAEDCLKLAGVMHKNDIVRYQKTDVLKWMEESRSLLSTVYDYKGAKLDDAYVDKAVPVIKMQLLKAGLRLAAVLNQTFSK